MTNSFKRRLPVMTIDGGVVAMRHLVGLALLFTKGVGIFRHDQPEMMGLHVCFFIIPSGDCYLFHDH